MKAHSRTNKSKRGSTEKNLQLARRMAKDVLAECASDTMCYGVHLWVFALLSKIASAAKSVEILTKCQQVGDCSVILRTMSDAAVMIEYILRDPSRMEQLKNLYCIEIAVEQYGELNFGAKLEGVTLEEVVSRKSYREKILIDYEKAKLRPAYYAKGKEWPKRWRYITVAEMCKDISGSKREFMVEHIMSTIPNAFAHSGPIALKQYYYLDKEGRPHFQDRTFKNEWYNARYLRGLASRIVLVSCKDIIENFSLSSSLKERLLTLSRRVSRTQFKDGA